MPWLAEFLFLVTSEQALHGRGVTLLLLLSQATFEGIHLFVVDRLQQQQQPSIVVHNGNNKMNSVKKRHLNELKNVKRSCVVTEGILFLLTKRLECLSR